MADNSPLFDTDDDGIGDYLDDDPFTPEPVGVYEPAYKPDSVLYKEPSEPSMGNILYDWQAVPPVHTEALKTQSIFRLAKGSEWLLASPQRCSV